VLWCQVFSQGELWGLEKSLKLADNDNWEGLLLPAEISEEGGRDENFGE
jgi:hypothetical protein